MTYEQYWHGDPLMVRAYYKAEQIRQQRLSDEAWLQGAYFVKALDATVGNMFRNKGQKPAEYPAEPIRIAAEEKSAEEQEEEDAAFALAYMTQMMSVGKSWGKKK